MIKGDRRWTARETYFPIRPRQRPDKVSLNFTFDGPGVVEMRNLQLTRKDLPAVAIHRRIFLTALWLIWRTLRFIVLMLLNIILFGVSAALGGDLTWWPKRKAPLIGKSSG